MKLYLATKNKSKFQEAKTILAPFGIILEQAPDCEKIEPKEWPIEKVAAENARRLAHASKKPIIVDDSGCFFLAYNNFPGSQALWCFNGLGYTGLLKVLKGKDRSATFRCAAALCFPNEEPVVFLGEMKGRIAEKPAEGSNSEFPYDRIFIIDGFDKPVCLISKEEKNKHSHRGNACRKLGAWVQSRGK